MSSRKQASQTRGQQSAEEENFKKPTPSNMEAASRKKSAGSQPKNLEPALPGRWFRHSAENPASNSEWKTRKNNQKSPGNGDGGSTCPRIFKNRIEVKVKIPKELKPWLVEDWDLVTRQKEFQLLAKTNGDAIFEEYANCKKSQGNIDNKEYAINELVGGIKEYFNMMLGTQLLYNTCVASHLVIRAMLAYTPLDEKSLALLLGCFHDFRKYLSKNSASLFTASDYLVASAVYHPKAL
uniref:Mortality factor 4-like protein 2 n=1 Tax=Cricetulus griseus TaxID=10029 RepID=A0A8C2N6M9_CRIGR